MILQEIHHSMKSGFAALSVLVACALLPSVASATCTGNTNPNLVKNTSFENHGSSGTTIDDWQVAFTTDEDVSVIATHAKTGTHSLSMGTFTGENRVSQTIEPAVAGSVYTVCFWLADATAAGTNRFRAQWNNQDMVTLTNAQGPATPTFVYYSFDITAVGNDVLSFEERNPPGFWYLDDVSVQLCNSCTISPTAPNAKRPEFPSFAKTH
jgi:hypothetical protein